MIRKLNTNMIPGVPYVREGEEERLVISGQSAPIEERTPSRS
jgi:hypothetical protein